MNVYNVSSCLIAYLKKLNVKNFLIITENRNLIFKIINKWNAIYN